MNIPRILILLTSLRRCGPVLGGVALAKHLDRSQWSVTVGSLAGLSRDAKPVVEDLTRSGIRFEIFDRPGWFGLMHMRKIHRFLRQENIDIVISYGLRPDIVNAFASEGIIRVASVRGMLRREYCFKYGSMVSALFTALHVYMLSRMHRVMAISKAMEKNLIEEGVRPEKIEYIPNFVDLSDTEQWYKHKSKSDSAITIGFIGNFIQSKRIDWVIRAFSAVKQMNPDIQMRLDLIGDGPSLPKMRYLVQELKLKDCVRFHGYVLDVFRYMADLDLVVMASKTEGIPRTLMEAMAMGKTCIASGVDGVAELIIERKTGYLSDPDNFDALADILDYVVRQGAFLKPKEVRNHIEKYYSAEVGAKATAVLFKRLLNKRHMGKEVSHENN